MTKLQVNIKNNILQLDASQIASFIRDGFLTSEECTHILIDHVKHVNPSLNAVVEDRFQLALQEAREKDEKIKTIDFNEQPLYGVPISIKESINVAGMKTTGGLHHRKDLMMSRDAGVVSKLKNAGAIILCKTNTPTLCFCHETDNKIYGRTNNAWRNDYTAGGSSGGEAALIGVGGSPVGLSSDIGGSIRIPSHFNGVVGFKPGMFQVDTEGHFPPDQLPLKSRMSTIGSIGKSVRDVQLIYKLIAKTKKKKPFYEKMQIEILPTDNGYPLCKNTADLITEIGRFLESKYHTTSSIPPFFTDSATVWQELMSIDGGKEIKELAFNKDRANPWKYYMHEKITGKSTIHSYLSWALIGANLFKPSKKRRKAIEAFLDESDHVLENYLSNRLLIFPVYHSGALPHGEVFKEIFSINRTYVKYMPYIAYANVWGLPSLTVPIGYNENNFPIAIQIMGKIGNEDAIFELGTLLEENFSGYIRSTNYD